MPSQSEKGIAENLGTGSFLRLKKVSVPIRQEDFVNAYNSVLESGAFIGTFMVDR